MTTQPPHSPEAESGVLGAIMIDNEALFELRGRLEPKHFYRESHRNIYRAMIELFDAGEPIDLVTVTERLRRAGTLDAVGGIPYLIGVADGVPTSANALHYANIVRDKAVLREVMAVGGRMFSAAGADNADPAQVLSDAERAVFSLMDGGARSAGHDAPALVSDTLAYLEHLAKLRGKPSGITTGFRDLDRMTGGLQPSGMYVLAARPSMGKTAMALCMAAGALRAGARVMICSLEMSAMQLMTRLLALEARVSLGNIYQGTCSDREWQRLTDASARVSSWSLHLDDDVQLTPALLRSKARRRALRHGLDLLIIDYLQLMEGGGGENRQQEIAIMSRGLKLLARELEVPVLVLSQLSRAVEARPNKRPLLSDLRESGAVEQDADVVMFIYRDDYYHPDSEKRGTAEVIFGKQRNGPTGVVEVQYQAEMARFNDLALPERVP